ncbi:hypothetical protein CF319_g3219 [Tilletia indica]|nr:hypothetical protein CF319_g3219 [Tilletia indica]
MPRTIVVVDGAGVQGCSVIQMLLNANLAVQKGPSQSSAGGKRPDHAMPGSISDIPASASAGPTSHGEAFRKLEDFDTLSAQESVPKRPSFPSFHSSESFSNITKFAEDHLKEVHAESPDISGKPKHISFKEDGLSATHGFPPCSLPEEELVLAAADAFTATVGPNVLSSMPGYFASSSCQQPLPSSLSKLESAAEPVTPELQSRLDLPIAPLHLGDSSNATDASPASDHEGIHSARHGPLHFSTPPTSPPQPPRKYSEGSPLLSLKSLHAMDEPKSSATSYLSAGSDASDMSSPFAMSSIAPSEVGTSKSSRFRSLGASPVWKLRSLIESSSAETAQQSAGVSKWVGSVETTTVKYSDPHTMRNAMAGIHGLFIGLDAFSSSPQLFVEKNIINIIQAAVSAGVQQVIFAGHIWEPNHNGEIISGNPKGSGEVDGSADIHNAASDGHGPDDLSWLPITVQRCTSVYRILRRLASAGHFRLTVFILPVCFEAGLLCEATWFTLRPKSNTYVLDMPVPSSTVMPFCSLSDVGNAALQVFSRPDRFDGVILDLTSDIASPRELCVQMTQVIYVSGRRVVHCDDHSTWLSAQVKAASEGDTDSKKNIMSSKAVNSLLLREFILFMATFARKPLTLLLPQVRTNARRYNLRLTPWREFAVNFCDDLLVAWR